MRHSAFFKRNRKQCEEVEEKNKDTYSGSNWKLHILHSSHVPDFGRKAGLANNSNTPFAGNSGYVWSPENETT